MRRDRSVSAQPGPFAFVRRSPTSTFSADKVVNGALPSIAGNASDFAQQRQTANIALEMVGLVNWRRAVVMWLAAFLIVAAAVYRSVAHPYNVAPIDAIFLLSALYLPRRGALIWAIPFAAVIFSDAVVYYQWNGSFFHAGRLIDYAAFALIALMGLWAKQRGMGSRVASVLMAPLVFFLVSNFGVWLIGDYAAAPLYSRDFAGLLSCYWAGLPFFKGTLVGDLIFAGGAILLIEAARQSRTVSLRRLAHPA